MHEEKKDQAKSLKGIRICDLLMFFGRNKIGFKLLEDGEHYTIKFLPEGIIDLHQTIEGIDRSSLQSFQSRVLLTCL